jgi:hypothetical protein
MACNNEFAAKPLKNVAKCLDFGLSGRIRVLRIGANLQQIGATRLLSYLHRNARYEIDY